MVLKNLKSPRRLVVLAAFAILAISAFGFAASNDMPSDTKAGDGDSPISGYVVSNVHYNLDDSTPAEIDEVEFTLNAAADEVRVSIGSVNSTGCTNSGTDWTCTMPDGVGVTAADELYLVAVQ